MALMEKYGVSTIPALVLLDGEGALIYNCGHDHLRKDPTGKGFPWPALMSGPHPAQVGFAIPPLAEVLPMKPTGKPPPFPQPRRTTAMFAGWAPSGFSGWEPSGTFGSDYRACRDVGEASGDNLTVPHHCYPNIIHSETGALGGRTTAKAANKTEHQCPQPPTSHLSRSPGSPGGV